MSADPVGDRPTPSRDTEKEGASSCAQTAPEIVASVADDATFRHDSRRPDPEPSDAADDALRAAVKAAIDAGDFARATALLEILKAAPKPAPVVSLAARRERR